MSRSCCRVLLLCDCLIPNIHFKSCTRSRLGSIPAPGVSSPLTTTATASNVPFCQFLLAFRFRQLTLVIHSAVPPTESALANLHRFATHPHFASSETDSQDARDVLSFYQNEFGISSLVESIFDVNPPESCQATLSTTSELKSPYAWINVYYPVMETGNADDISLEILGHDEESICRYLRS